MQILVGVQEMFLGHFNAWSGLQGMQMKPWLEGAASCSLLAAFHQDFLPFQAMVSVSPSAGAVPGLFDHFPWKSLGCSY